VKKWHFDLGHLRSQKFAGFVFATVACFLAGLFQFSEASTQAVCMSVVALYTAFVGGRTMSDNAALKFSQPERAQDVPPAKKPPAPPKEKKDNEVD